MEKTGDEGPGERRHQKEEVHCILLLRRDFGSESSLKGHVYLKQPQY